MATNAGSLKKGDFIHYQGDIWQVQKAEFYSPGKGSALMRTRIKNVTNGKNIEYTYKSAEMVDTVEVNSIELQYLYKDNENLFFMDERSYNQYQLPLDLVGDVANYLKEGTKHFVYIYDEKPIAMRPPPSVRLKVVETEDAVKGDTVSGAKKTAKLETGVVINVPLFVKTGDLITVNPETGQYGERVKQ